MSNNVEIKTESEQPAKVDSSSIERKELTGEYSWLILGGVGFIGRHFAKYLVDNNLANAIRVTDKSHWAMSMLNDEHKLVISKVCEYKQADLTKKLYMQSYSRIMNQCEALYINSSRAILAEVTLLTYCHVPTSHLAHVEGVMDREFDFIVNLCGETRPNIPDAEVKSRTLDPVNNCIAIAKTWKNFKKWIEVSTAQVYPGSSKSWTEATSADSLSPWTMQARLRLEAEKIVRASGLPHVVVRPAIVYGPGDIMGLMPRLCCAAVYKKTGETMTFLWNAGLKINTVHVTDVAKALYYVATKQTTGYNTYNLVDTTDFDQGKLTSIIESLFRIRTDFMGLLKSTLARISLKSATDTANEYHMPIWSSLLKERGVENTPLSTYISYESLGDSSLSVDGQYICTSLDFTYDHPRCTEEEVRNMIEFAISQGIYPRGMLAE